MGQYGKGIYLVYGAQEFCHWLGWNETKQTVECSKEWWDEHLAIV
jgi:hypothetical protein